MGDEDLEELARLSASTRQFVVAVALAIVLGGVAMWLAVGVFAAPVKAGAIAVGGAFALAMGIGLSLRTPPHRFPSIRVLRDRPRDVAYIVSVVRGKQLLALAGPDGSLLAKPLVLKGSPLTGSVRTADAAVRELSGRHGRALALVRARCPQAKTASATDHTGMRSVAKLVKKAIAG